MNSKERVLRAIEREEPDRVPTSFCASPWVVERLKDRLGVSTDRELLEELGVDIFDTRGIDIRGGVGPDYVGPEIHGVGPENWDGNLLKVWGIRQKVVETQSGKTYQHLPPPLADAKSAEELEAYAWPDPEQFDYEGIRERLEPWSDFAVLCSGASVFQHPAFLRGMDKLLMDISTSPEMADFLLDKFTNFYHRYYEKIFQRAADLIDIFWIADDFGMQDRLLISPKTFEDVFLPRLQRLIDLAKDYDTKVLFHSDGNIRKIIPKLIEMGVDVLDPIQPEAAEMDPPAIKEEFGEKICLRGAISAQEVLSKGTVEDVREEVKRRIEQLAPGGGYILSPGHPVLQVDVPTENIVAMYEAAAEYGGYKRD